MVKKVVAFRHSLKDGPGNTLGPKGLTLAFAQGKEFEGENLDKFFHGTLTRTAQTALAFLAGWDNSFEIMPPVEEFGSDALFAEMTAPSMFRELAGAHGNFKALLHLHDIEQVKGWARNALVGLQKVFISLNGDEVGVCFTHSPTLELALWAALDFQDLPEEFAVISEMDGLQLMQDDAGKITATKKYSAPTIK